MKVFIGADHRGFELKEKLTEWLNSNKYQAENCGAFYFEGTDDYTDFAKEVGEKVTSSQGSRGILVCGSGVGVNITANKINGVLCSIGFDPKQIKAGVEDDNMNILCLASDYTDESKAIEIIKTFLESSYQPTENHERRLDKIKSLEN